MTYRSVFSGALRRDVVPGGSGLGKRFRGNVRQGQYKRERSVQGTFEPSEDQVRPRTVVAAKLGSTTISSVRRRCGSRVNGADARATGTSAKESQRQRRQRWRWRRRWGRGRKIQTQLVLDIVKEKRHNMKNYRYRVVGV